MECHFALLVGEPGIDLDCGFARKNPRDISDQRGINHRAKVVLVPGRDDKMHGRELESEVSLCLGRPHSKTCDLQVNCPGETDPARLFVIGRRNDRKLNAELLQLSAQPAKARVLSSEPFKGRYVLIR